MRDQPLYQCDLRSQDPGYEERIRARVSQRAEWVTLYKDVNRLDVCRLMAAHRYGLGTVEEDFGMAVAELVRAGTIVFVPQSGGQIEIVGGDERFLYSTVDEAAEKIARTMQDPVLQKSLRVTLAPMRERFSSDRFVQDFRRIVRAAPVSRQ